MSHRRTGPAASRVHDIDDSKLSEIRAHGGLDVEGERVEFAAVDCATTDLEAAIDGADVIIIVTGGNTQAAVARSGTSVLRRAFAGARLAGAQT